MKYAQEIRIGLIITAAGVIATAFIGYNAWLADTVYTQNGTLSSLQSTTNDTQQTVHTIEDLLLNHGAVTVK